MSDTNLSPESVGFIAIGRNEGERLKVGLVAIRRLYPQCPVVYVDSGSTDDSVAFAKSIEVETLTLDMSAPFTAARARNSGARYLLNKHQNIRSLQFLDGDCEIVEEWIEAGLQVLNSDPNIGIASGRRLERFPEASTYNKLMDLEWNTAVGKTTGVPGDMLIRVEVFRALIGFNPNMIAGEDFDLCIRAQKLGFSTYRVDAHMSNHDADIMRFSQWCQRVKRGGHAYANLYHIHPDIGPSLFKNKFMSIIFWGGLIPLAFPLSLFISLDLAIAIACGTGLTVTNQIVYRLRSGDSLKMASIYGSLVYITKLPELLGIYEYWKVLLRKEKHSLIEYK